MVYSYRHYYTLNPQRTLGIPETNRLICEEDLPI